jgi:uncharacterized protein YbjT (DUF2867 family)
MTNKTAVLVGATGLVGAELLTLLLASPHYASVIVLARRATGRVHEKLTEYVVDFNHLPNLSVRVDDVFCALGTTIKAAGSQAAFREVDCVYPLNVAQWAKRLGAQQFLMVSAMGASTASRIFYNQVKGEAEQSIIGLNLATTVFARPSLLTGERSEHRTVEQLGVKISPLLNMLLIGPLKKYRPIAARQVAQALYAKAHSHLSGLHVFESDALQKT